MKVSIIIPTYKRPDLLDRLLKSIAKQSHKYFEIIVVDDFSPNWDEYAKLINKYKKVFKELSYYRNDSNYGAPYSRNKGIKHSKYDLLALVDDDDEWLEEKLEKQIAIFKNDQKIGLVYTWTQISDNGKIMEDGYRSVFKGNVLKDILRECFIPSPSVMVNKKAIIDAGLFDINFPSCQDWDMWTRIFKKGYECGVVEEYATIYHKHQFVSIGNSTKARKGYNLYYQKHAIAIIKHLKIEGIEILLKQIYSNIIRSRLYKKIKF